MADSTQQHLERLVFEVYGVEEGKRRINELMAKEKEHAQSMKGLAKQAKEAAKEEEKAADKIAAAHKKRREETQKTLKVAGAGLVALAALAAEASADLEEANSKVERSFRKAGASSTEMAKALDAADERARKLGLGLVETRANLSTLIDASGDYKTALGDLSLAQDIAADNTIDQKAATELLRKARKGEISELINLNGVTKTSIENLMSIGDDAARGAAAIDLVAKASKGAADELSGTNDAIKNLKEAGVDLLAVVGDTGKGLINAFSSWFGVIEPGEDILNRFATGMRNFSRDAKEAAGYLDAWVEWQEQGGALGQEGFFDVVSRRDTEAAVGAADEFVPTARTRETAGRGGRRGYGGNRGGHRDVPRQRAAKRGTRSAKEPRGPIDLDEGAADFDRAAEERESRRRHWEARRQSDEAAARDARKAARVADAATELAEIEKLEQAKADIRMASIDAAIAGAGLIGGTIADLAKSEKAGLAIDAVVASARAGIAWGMATTPPPLGGPHFIPGAIAQTAAAANAAIIAGVGIAKPGKVASKMGKGGGATSLSDSRDRLALSGEQSRSREARESKTAVVNVYSTFGPSPEDSRRLVDTVEREMGNRT